MIVIKDLNIKLTNFSLKNINISINEGDFFALLGPTGSGKTMLLEAIAGLKSIESGSIKVMDTDVVKLPPEKRNISIVYQDYALFPNMTVEKNIRYGLRFKKNLDMKKVEDNFCFLVKMLRIDHILNRHTQNLSGGEKQRVALARALIIEPDILLLDEPFSALDTNTKEGIQLQIKNLYETLKTTIIMVTHNFSEVFSLADKVGIIKEGQIIETGTVEEVFKYPTTRFAAEFVGMKNIFNINDFITGIKENQNNWEEVIGYSKNSKISEVTSIGIRPESIMISKDKVNSDFNFIGSIINVVNSGPYLNILVESYNLKFHIFVTANRYLELGLSEKKRICFGFNKTEINLIR